MTLRSEASAKLKSFIERIERLAQERRELGDEQRALFAEAKAEGFDPRAMRKIIKRREKSADELAEEETIFDTYMHALGMLPEHPLHAQIGRLARDGLAREDVIDALQTLVPNNREIIAKLGGDPVRIWRDEDGTPFVEPYVEPAATPREKTGKALGKRGAVLSIVTGEAVDRAGTDPSITAAADRAERAARKKRGEDEPHQSPAGDGADVDTDEPVA